LQLVSLLIGAALLLALAAKAAAEQDVPVAPLSIGPISEGTAPAKEAPATASGLVPADHLQQHSDLAVSWMQEYLRIDTTNPPGHEMRAVAFYKKILDQEGIENRVFEYTAGRGDLWARLPRTTAQGERLLILLNHMDVVTSDASHWKVPPFRLAIYLGPSSAFDTTLQKEYSLP